MNRGRAVQLPEFPVAQGAQLWRYNGNQVPVTEGGAVDRFTTVNRYAMNVMLQKSQEIRAEFPHLDKIATAVYPFAGNDGALPWMVAPNLKTVITIDQVPFFRTPTAIHRLNYFFPSYPYEFINSVTDSSEVGPQVMGTLAQIFPHFRIVSLTVFRTEPAFTHAILRFDNGPGTDERQLIHINSRIGFTFKKEFWPVHIEKMSVDAVFVKAAFWQMQRLDSEDANTFSGWLKSLLKKSRGFLIEGLQKLDDGSIGGELSGPQNPYAHTVFQDIPYGYLNQVAVTHFRWLNCGQTFY